MQARYERLPVAFGAGARHALHRTHPKDLVNATAKPSFDDGACELAGDASLFLGHTIRLVEHEYEIAYVGRSGGDEIELFARYRRIRANHHDCRVDLGNERVRRDRIGLEHGAEPGRIDER